MIYAAPFDTSQISGTVTFTQVASPFHTAVITLSTMTALDYNGTASSIYWPGGSDQTIPGSVISTLSVDSSEQARHKTYAKYFFLDSLGAAVNAAWGGPTISNATINLTTGFYEIGASEDFTVTCSTAEIRRLFGFATSPISSSSGYLVGTFQPTYTVFSELTTVSVTGGQGDALDYEPRGIGNHPIADDGQGYGMARTVSPLYRDWVQQFETKIKTLRRSKVLGTSVNNWTYQELFEYCRGIWPFCLYPSEDSDPYDVFSFRDDGLSWNPERASPGNDTAFHIPFKTVHDGYLNIAAPPP